MKEFTVLDLLDLDLKEHNHLQLTCMAGRSGLSRPIKSAKIARPGLALAGFFVSFSGDSIQLIGRSEQSYIDMLEERGEYENIEKLFGYNVPCFIFIGDYMPSEHFIELAEKKATALLTTPLESSDFSRRLYSQLDEVFAATMTIHGVLVEVYGIGVLITGDSGVGKSETALELIERGHRLISDDTVKLKNISDAFLIGSGENPMLAHHMEIRGLGIINLTNLFGVGAIREKKQVELSVFLETWDQTKQYDRIGDTLTDTFLGITVPKIVIPVRPGRNVPILIETAARNERLKKQLQMNKREWPEFKDAVQKLKEVKFHMNIGSNDYAYKLKHAIDFLQKGCRLKATLVLRGREMAHKDMADELIDRIVSELSAYGEADGKPKLLGRNITVTFAPSK